MNTRQEVERQEQQAMANAIHDAVVAGLEEFKPGLSEDAQVLLEAEAEVMDYVQGWNPQKWDDALVCARANLRKGQVMGDGSYVRRKHCMAEFRAGIRRCLPEYLREYWDAETLHERSNYADKAQRATMSHCSKRGDYRGFEEVCQEFADYYAAKRRR